MTAQVITINDSSRDHNQYIIMIALRSAGLILCEGEADRGSQGLRTQSVKMNVQDGAMRDTRVRAVEKGKA